MPGAPQAILQLVELFDRNRTQYHRPDYNETQVRREFIDPFFEALGWDVRSRPPTGSSIGWSTSCTT